MQVRNRRGNNRGSNANVMFAIVGRESGNAGSKDENYTIPGTNGRLVENEYYICHKKGHISWYCPEAGNTGPPQRDKKNLNCTQFGFVQQMSDGIRV